MNCAKVLSLEKVFESFGSGVALFLLSEPVFAISVRFSVRQDRGAWRKERTLANSPLPSSRRVELSRLQYFISLALVLRKLISSACEELLIARLPKDAERSEVLGSCVLALEWA